MGEEEVKEIPPLKWESVPNSKQAIREKIWNYIEENDFANFPRPVANRIPNVKDVDIAAEKIQGLKAFQNAKTVKVNPDKPQEAVRYYTLLEEKELLVPTTRLKSGLFNKIVPPSQSEEDLRKCATSQGVRYHRQPQDIDAEIKIDVLFTGSVAVSKKGYRLGRGQGFEDLEYAMMRSMGVIDETTPIITTVHDCQIVDIPDEIMEEHDFDVDYILTPTQLIECSGGRPKPKGIIWSILSRLNLRKLPVLRILRRKEKDAGVDVTMKILPRRERSPAKEHEEHAEEGEESPREGGRRGGYRGRRPRRTRRGSGRRGNISRRRPKEEQSGDESKENVDPDQAENEHENEERGERSSRGGRGRGHGRGRGRGRGRGGYGRRGYYRGRRPQGGEGLDPALYVGGIGEDVRVSSFKNLVREKGVNPIQVMWRGKKGYAFLVFKDLETASDALKELEGMKYEDYDLTVKMSNKFTTKEEAEEKQ